MKYFLNLMIFLMANSILAQTNTDNTIVDKELSLLINLKCKYEKYREIAKQNPMKKYEDKRDSLRLRYLEMIKHVKALPKVYLTHIDKAIADGKVNYLGTKSIIYNYVDVTTSNVDVGLYALSRLDAYKVIKKSLFQNNDSELPERTELYLRQGGKNRSKFILPDEANSVTNGKGGDRKPIY